MNKPIIDFPNLEMPIAYRIREALAALSVEQKSELLEKMTENEFIEHRVDIFLEQVEAAFITGKFTPGGAEEYALHECMAGLEGEA